MKILMLSNNYLPHTSGVGTSITRTTRNLELLGHDVELVVPDYPKYFEPNPKIHRVPSVPFAEPLIPLPIPGKRLVRQIVEHFKPDLLHTHHPFLLGKTALHIAKEKNIPIVMTYHSMYEEYIHYIPLLPESILKNSVIRKVKKVADQMNAIVAPSESIFKILHERKFKSPVHIIPTGINPEYFIAPQGARTITRTGWNVNEKDIVIISFARLAPEKNFELLLQAFARILKETSAVKLVLGGDGPAKTDLEKMAKKLGIEKSTIFTGEIPHENVSQFLAGGDIFAYSSLSETQGLVTLEALASGLPTVVTDAPGNRDAVQNNVCGLISDTDLESFSSALMKLVFEKDLRTKLAGNARKRAEEFSETKMAKKMESLYKSLLEK
jgi:glycosyltransferase involved in cell wall biosynthesis